MSNRLWNVACLVAIVYFSISAYGALRGNMKTDATDRSKDERSGLKLHTDYGTGCQYLSAVRGGVFPRIDTDGVKQMGCGQL